MAGAKWFARRDRQWLKQFLWLAAADAVMVVAAYWMTYSIRREHFITSFTSNERLFTLGAVIISLFFLYAFGAYHRIWARTSGHEAQVLIIAHVIATMLLLALDFLITPRPFPLSVVLVGGGIAMNGSVAVRYQTRLITGLRWRWRAIWHMEFPDATKRVLIVGAGDLGQITAMRLKYRAPEGSPRYRIMGFVDDDPQKRGMMIEGCRVLGRRIDIPRLVEQYQVDLIVVAIHNIEGSAFREILEQCEETTVQIKIVPDVFAALSRTQNTPLLRDLQPEDLLGRQPVGWHEGVDVSFVSHKVVLVTGAAGSIGSELCRQMLTYHPVKLILLDNNESGIYDLMTEIKTTANEDILVPFLADITNRQTLISVFEAYHPQVIFHSAAYKHVPMLQDYPNEAVRVNIAGTRQVALLAREYGAERFVLISTDKAVKPASIMGASKRICELLMHALAQQGALEKQGGHHTLFTSVRFGNVLGSRGSVVPTFTRQIDAGGPVTVTDPEMTRYFMTIPEAVNLVIHAACLTEGDDLFMLRMGEVVRIVELAERMIRMRGLVPNKDILIQFTGMRPGEKLHEELHTETEETIATMHPYIVELICSQNGINPELFSSALDRLSEMKLGESGNALQQLQAVIELGEAHYLNPVS